MAQETTRSAKGTSTRRPSRRRPKDTGDGDPPGSTQHDDGTQDEDRAPEVVRWPVVAAVVRSLGRTADLSPGSWDALETLSTGLTEPLRELEALERVVKAAVDGDDHAAQQVVSTVHRLAQQVDSRALASALGERPAHRGPCTTGCGCSRRPCGCGEDEQPPAPPAPPPARPQAQAASGVEGLLDESALTALAVGAVRVVGPDLARAALDVVTALVLGAGALGSLAVRQALEGDDGVVRHLETVAGRAGLTWVSGTSATAADGGSTEGAPVRTLSGPGVPGDLAVPARTDLAGLPTLGGMPGVPGLDDLPDLPDPSGLPRLPGRPKDPTELNEWFQDRRRELIEQLLGQLRGRKRWDPDRFDHRWPWWRDPLEWIEPQWWDLVRCFLRMRRLLAVVDEPRPARPARAVWTDGITGVSASDVCAGGTVTISGAGFGATQPPDVVLLLPTLEGCRPVTPTSWSDDTITAVLPADVASGPVGFADAAYVAAYDAWAARHNDAVEELRGLPCYRRDLPRVLGFRECPRETRLTHLRAGAPVILAFTANMRTVLGLEPGTPLVLRWTVKNAEQVRVERTSSSGPLFSGSTTLTDPPSAFHSFGTPSSSGLQTWTYRLTADGPCGGPVSRTVTVVATRRPRLRIEAIEVTQSIQTIPETVRLVRSKPTIVRVTVRHGLAGWGTNTVPGVRGRLRVRIPGVGTSAWVDAANGSGTPMAPRPGASITVTASPSRNTTDDTLNFLVPAGWARGSSTRFDVEVRVAGFGAAAGFPGFSETVSRTTAGMTFEERRTLQLRFVRVRWNGVAAATDAVCRTTLRGAVPLLPTPTAGIAALAGVGTQVVTTAPGSNGDAERRNLLDRMDDLHNCSAFEAAFEWLGLDCPEDDGAIWVLIPGQFVRGEAYDIPSNVCMTPPSNGPYAAHELAHCLNQTHVSVACANGQTAGGGDAPSAWPNSAQAQDVPFDVTRHRALSLSGTGVFDVMTYCGTPDNTWPIPARWQRLWDRIGS